MTSKTGPLPYESMTRIAMIVSRASKVFGSEDAAARWLRTPNPGLAGQTPLACLDTEIGIELVFQMLGGIESGGGGGHP
jgi:putative toxin-antitoxin system antitoxin component (TIGR02293 family)